MEKMYREKNKLKVKQQGFLFVCFLRSILCSFTYGMGNIKLFFPGIIFQEIFDEMGGRDIKF